MRASQPLDDREAIYKVLTILGASGSLLLGLQAVSSESAENIAAALKKQVSPANLQHTIMVTCDQATASMAVVLKNTMPNLRALALDTLHLAMAYESCQWKKLSPGSKVLRQILENRSGKSPIESRRL